MSKKISRKNKVPKKVNLKKVVLDKSKPEPDNLYVYEGKKYVVGAVVSVGYDPYFVKKTKRGRKQKSKLDKPKIVETEDVEGEEGGEDGEWEGEYGPEKQQVISEEEVGSEEEDPEVEGELRTHTTVKKGKKQGWEEGQTFKEKEVDIFEGAALEFAKEFGLPYKESRLVSEPHKYKLDDYYVRYRGYDKFVVAERKNKDGSVKLYLKPYSPPRSNKINIIDGDFLPPPVPFSAYVPEKSERIEPPKKYKGSLRLGDRVTFIGKTSEDLEGAMLDVGDEDFDIVTPYGKLYKNVKYRDAQNLRFKVIPKNMLGVGEGTVVVKDSNGNEKIFNIDLVGRSKKADNTIAKLAKKAPYKYAEFTLETSELLNGVILDYDEEGFVVSVIQNGMADTVIVNYDDSSIKKCTKCKGINEAQTESVNEAEDYLQLSVENKTRLHATKQLFQVLASVIPGVYESPIDQDPEIQKLGAGINWSIANPPLKSWETFYEEQFNAWVFSKSFHEYFAKAPSFETKAEEEYESSVDPVLIIEGLEYVFGDIFSGNGAKLLFMMDGKAKQDSFRPTIIDIAIRKHLNRLSNDELEQLEGSYLAMTVATIIQNTMESNPPPTREEIEVRLRREWAGLKASEYVLTKKDKAQFDREYLEKLTLLYEDYEKDVKRQKVLKDKYETLRKKLETEHSQRSNIQQKIHRFKTMAVDGKQLSDVGLLLADNVSMLEEKMYVESTSEIGGKTNENYLHKILTLIAFLDSETEIGKHTKFLKSKIASGIFEIDQLDSMTYVSMFPEFFANDKYKKSTKDDAYKKPMAQIEQQIELSILDFIDIWILDNQPRARGSSFNKIVWDQYLESPSKSCGGLRIRKGLKYGGIEDSENYNCEKSQGDPSKYFCKAKLEPIPDDDLILCYDESSGKFTCSSIDDVLYALWEQGNGEVPINPMTGKPYDTDFLERMRLRYGDLMEGRDFTKRVLSFTTTEDELLFGEPAKGESSSEGVLPIEIQETSVERAEPIAKSKKISLKKMLKDAGGKKLLVVFKPTHLKSEKFREIYEPYEKKLKVFMIDSDEKNISEFQKSLGFKKQPLFAIYTNSKKKPKVVYLQSITKGFSYQEALKSIA